MDNFSTFINDGNESNYTNVATIITRASTHSGFTGTCATYAAQIDTPVAYFEAADAPDDATKYSSTLGL